MYRGTYQPNKRPVYTTAPDCLVYINGELSLPSGANPNRRVPLQPLITSVNVNLGVNSVPGSASIDLQIPRHYLDDLYVGGKLTLTTMLEVQIYAKGHFTVGGAPRYYPLFWGVVTSVGDNYASGENTVSLSCTDILYWWQVSQININPSYLAAQAEQSQKLNFRGHTFTGMNAFDIIYSLSRYVYGDSMNVRNQSVDNRQFRTEPISGAERKRLMAYWTLKWGRITNNLKMFGPSGQVLQGGQLASLLSGENRDFFLKGRKGSAKRDKIKDYEPFKQGGFDVSAIAPFSQKISQLGAMELTNSEFETKLNLALQTKEAINYEFYMDVTGEIIFKPPFFNMDTRPNFPVSWIRASDVISRSWAENPPEATFIEATGRYTQNVEIGLGELVQTRATYVDYRLVQKYGFRPGSFSSEFIGSRENNGPKALFYHLVDVLDQQNARVNSGTLTIPFRPELRLGYPVYYEPEDVYYYVEGISHSFSYGARCTTSLTLMARRDKFYGAFERWREEQKEPQPSDIALPGDIPRNIEARQRDGSGFPRGDRNVIMTYIPEIDFERFGGVVPTFDEDATDSDRRLRNLVSLRTQFSNVTDNKYVYAIDPNRDTPYQATEENNRQVGPITHIEADPQIALVAGEDGQEVSVEVNAVVFPISDEAGYEVIGSYEYGRRVSVTTEGYRFDQTPEDRAVELLLDLSPDRNTQGGQTTPNATRAPGDNPASAHEADASQDKTLRLDPNNYGRRLSELAPPNHEAADPTSAARVIANQSRPRNAKSSGPATSGPDPETTQTNASDQGVSVRSKRGRVFKYNSNVARWRPTIRRVRSELGLSEEVYSDELVLAIIHTESSGNPSARRTDKNGNPAQYVGLLQVGESNAQEFNRRDQVNRSNEDFYDPELSIRHFLRYADLYDNRHQNDPTKIAILWKAGPGALSSYNAYENSNPKPSQAELNEWLKAYPSNVKPDKKPWGLDRYISDETSARQVWAQSLDPVAPNQVLQEGETAVREEAVLQGDEADDPEAAGRINIAGLPDLIVDEDDDVRIFAEALEANREDGTFTLPTNIRPPRDPGVITALNEFLLALYERTDAARATRERELRGEDRYIAPLSPSIAPVGGQVPVILPASVPQNQGLNTQLARQEIRDRLDNGETLGQVLGSEVRDATSEELLQLDKARRDLDTAVNRVTGQSNEVSETRIIKGETSSDLLGAPVAQSLETLTGLDNENQTRILSGNGTLEETRSVLDELEAILDSEE